MIREQKKTLMKRRKIAIIVSLALIVLLIPVIVLVRYMHTTSYFYDVDDTRYIVRYKKGVYTMYDGDGNELSIDGQYGYYITDIGTLVEIDTETGAISIIAAVDTEDNEELGHNQRILIFPHTEKKNIRSIEVVNDEGTFTFVRYNLEKDMVDDTSDFIIKGSPFTLYDQELFASLHVSAGYTISTRKIVDPIKDANGEFSEYGLVSETRVDDDGEEYEYTPAYYILTDTSGNKHKLIIGDMLVTGGGYYVQYVSIVKGVETKRDAVYVLSPDFGETMLAPIEDFVTPTVVYPMTMNTYFDVENFVIAKKDLSIEDGIKPIVGFTYIDLTERENTIEANFPYKFDTKSMEGYIPDSDNINDALYALYETAYVGVEKLAPSDKDLLKYGLSKEVTDKDGKITYEPDFEYMISFDYDLLGEDGKPESTIQQVVMISAKNEDGNYYAYTMIYDAETDEFLYSYDMIVEIHGYCFDFLEWDSYKWINDTYISLNIAFADKIKIESPGYSAEFDLDNSKSDQSAKINSDMLEISATDSKGNDLRTFSSLTVIDSDNNLWTITATDIKCYNAAGTEMKISTARYVHNKLGSQVRVVSGYIPCKDGSRVYVTAEAVEITDSSGNVINSYDRSATSLFRRYFQTLITATIEDSYVMSEEDEKALLADESKWMLTITLTTTDGEERVYSFYSLTSRKAYITINGNGGFYVLTNRVNKFISDAQRFFAGEVIDPTAKN